MTTLLSGIDSLHRFAAIGWDFDGTLHRHPKSWLMHAFIRQNPQIRHHIVTFRSHGWQHEIFDDLAHDYSAALVREHFASVINIPDAVFDAYTAKAKLRSYGRLTGALSEPETFLHHWKAEACLAHGIPVLVDDDTPRVIDGCQKHGIVHLHPDSL